jgi:hypothetical protein
MGTESPRGGGHEHESYDFLGGFFNLMFFMVGHRLGRSLVHSPAPEKEKSGGEETHEN